MDRLDFFKIFFFCEIACKNLFSLTNAKGESCIGNEILSPNAGQFIDTNQLNSLIQSLNFILLLMLHKDSAGARCADTVEDMQALARGKFRKRLRAEKQQHNTDKDQGGMKPHYLGKRGRFL